MRRRARCDLCRGAGARYLGRDASGRSRRTTARPRAGVSGGRRGSSARSKEGHDRIDDLDERTRTELEAAAFRTLVEHLRAHPEVQNIDLMNLAGFCRNCLSKWYRAATEERGLGPVRRAGARDRLRHALCRVEGEAPDRGDARAAARLAERAHSARVGRSRTAWRSCVRFGTGSPRRSTPATAINFARASPGAVPEDSGVTRGQPMMW